MSSKTKDLKVPPPPPLPPPRLTLGSAVKVGMAYQAAPCNASWHTTQHGMMAHHASWHTRQHGTPSSMACEAAGHTKQHGMQVSIYTKQRGMQGSMASSSSVKCASCHAEPRTETAAYLCRTLPCISDAPRAMLSLTLPYRTLH